MGVEVLETGLPKVQCCWYVIILLFWYKLLVLGLTNKNAPLNGTFSFLLFSEPFPVLSDKNVDLIQAQFLFIFQSLLIMPLMMLYSGCKSSHCQEL